MTSPPPGSPGALQRLEQRFKLRHEPVTLGKHRLVLPEFVHPQAYIEQRASKAGDLLDLPYWTKIWPAAVVLANFVSSWKLSRKTPLIELGAGLGLPGLVAAQCGHPVLLTDHDPDALEFARAAVELNQLEQLVEVRSLDWMSPPDDLGVYRSVIAAEVLYYENLFPSLVHLLARILDPVGTAYISHEERPFGISFFKTARESFTIRSTSCTFREGGDSSDTRRVLLHALRHTLGAA